MLIFFYSSSIIQSNPAPPINRSSREHIWSFSHKNFLAVGNRDLCLYLFIFSVSSETSNLSELKISQTISEIH